MVCLDTSFVIDLLDGKKEAGDFLAGLEDSEESIFVASPTVMEIVRGAYLSLQTDKEKEKINEILSSLIILNFDRECAFRAGEIDADLSKRGEKIGVEDVMIASIALQNDEALVTGNVKHFEKVDGLEIKRY